MDSLGRLQQRIVSPVLRGRSPSPERTNSRGWGIRRSRGLNSRYHSAPISAGSSMHREKSKPLMSTRRGQFSTSGSTAPGSSRAESPQKSFTDYLNDVIIPIPIQMPVDEFNLHKSSGAQSFCSTSKMKYVALPHVSESRASSSTSPRPNSRPVPMCSERYMVTPITHISFPKSKSSPRTRPKSEQQQRFEEGAKALSRCRVLKRTSEILSHRMDRLYYMSGVGLNLGNRYATDEEALRQMQALAKEARMLQLKNNTPCDSLPKLNQLSPEPSQYGIEDTAEQTNGVSRSGKGEDHDSSLTHSSVEKENSFFITQNGANDVHHSELPSKTENSQATVDNANGQGDFVSSGDNVEEYRDDEQKDITAGGEVKPQGSVGDRRRFLFGSTERPKRRGSLLTEKSSRRVSSLYSKYKDQEESKDENLEELEVSDEGEESGAEDDDEVLSSEEVSIRMQNLLKKGQKTLQHDRSIFKDRQSATSASQDEDSGVKYTSLVHKEEKKKEEFRQVTRHLVVKQEESILLVEPNMDEEQAAMFSKLFSDIDTDNDGKIGLEDLHGRLFRHLKAVDIPHFLRVFDINKDKKIDRREFLAVAGLNDKLCKQRTTRVDGNWNIDLEKLSYYMTVYKEMFDIVDIDHDGRLSLEELMVIIASSLDEETGTDIELMEDILESIDKDGNGSIDFVEYLQYIPMFLQIHNYLMRKPMLIEDIERTRRIVRMTLQCRSDSETSADNIWDE